MEINGRCVAGNVLLLLVVADDGRLVSEQELASTNPNLVSFCKDEDWGVHFLQQFSMEKMSRQHMSRNSSLIVLRVPKADLDRY